MPRKSDLNPWDEYYMNKRRPLPAPTPDPEDELIDWIATRVVWTIVTAVVALGIYGGGYCF